MAYDYDALYKTTPDALGAPTSVFVDFFNAHTQDALTVLDVGCGQGRDAVFIARLGHSVVGIDLSPNGIRDLNAAAAREGLDITGIAADVTTYDQDGLFDVVLIDRTLHMLDRPDRLAVFKRLIDNVQPAGWLLISDETSNMPDFKDLLAAHSANWTPELDKAGNLFVRRDADPAV